MSIYVDVKYLNKISYLLPLFKKTKDYTWNCRCPICGDSKKSATRARGYFYRNKNELYYNCKNCGAHMSMKNFIKDRVPYVYDEYLLERYSDGDDKKLDVNISGKFKVPNFKFEKVKKKLLFHNSTKISDLPDSHFCKKYVIGRKIPEKFHDTLYYTDNYNEFIRSNTTIHDEEYLSRVCDDKRLIIPYYDQYNELMAFTGRALEFDKDTIKYSTIKCREVVGERLIYGLDRMDKYKTVLVLEGPIDSMFFDNAIANGSADLNLAAKAIDVENMILVPDNQPRHRELVKIIGRLVRGGYNVVLWPHDIPYKDVGEMIENGMSVDDIEDIIRKNTFQGLNAELEFSKWRKI